MKNAAEKHSCDTWLDRRIHRPPARFLAKLLSRTAVHPNALTVFSLAPATAAGVYFCYGTVQATLKGLFFYYLWAVLDHADGELARTTNRTSRFGKWLDDFCDVLASNGVTVGIFLGLSSVTGWTAPRTMVAFLGGHLMEKITGILVLIEKNRLRQSHQVLDHFTGRDLIYFLILWLVFTYAWGGGWPYFTMLLLIGGCYALAFGMFAAWANMRSCPPAAEKSQ